MAKKKKVDLAEFSLEELKDQVVSEQSRLQQLEFAHVVSPLENPLQIRVARRGIAKLKTEIKRRQLAETNNDN